MISTAMIPPQKHLFDIPDSHAYFNTAYMSPLMHEVVDEMRRGIDLKRRPWTYSADQFFAFVEDFRNSGAQIFGGSAENIAIIPSASYGLQTAANALPLTAGQNILTLEDQFPSNIYPWQDKAGKQGGSCVILPTPTDHDWTSAVLNSINQDTAIAALPQTHWSSGATLDLEKIRRALDQVGAALVLDLTQSLGAQPFNAARIKPDFAVAATYKWLLGPYTCGLLYVDPKWHGAEPLEHNWINRAGSEDFRRLTDYRSEFQPGARRFDMGEKSNPPNLLGGKAALEKLLGWGVGNIADALGAKTRRIETQLARLGFKALPARAPHYLAMRHDNIDLQALLTKLSGDNIFLSARGNFIRITPHLYTGAQDEDRLIGAVQAFVK